MHSAERITIDFNIYAQSLVGKIKKHVDFGDVVILESKASTKKSPSSHIMKNYGIEPSKGCSKYALGVAYSGLADTFLHFLPTMKKMEQINDIQIISLPATPPVGCPKYLNSTS